MTHLPEAVANDLLKWVDRRRGRRESCAVCREPETDWIWPTVWSAPIRRRYRQPPSSLVDETERLAARRVASPAGPGRAATASVRPRRAVRSRTDQSVADFRVLAGALGEMVAATAHKQRRTCSRRACGTSAVKAGAGREAVDRGLL